MNTNHIFSRLPEEISDINRLCISLKESSLPAVDRIINGNRPNRGSMTDRYLDQEI